MFIFRRVVRHDYKALYQHLFFHSIHIHQYTKQFHAQIRKASKPTVLNHSFGGQLAKFVYYFFFGGLECVGHSFAYVAHFVFLGDVWIRTQRAAVASKRASNLFAHLPTT